MKRSLHKKVLTVRDKSGSHRQTYYVADEKLALKGAGHTISTTEHPRERVQVHYGMLWSGNANKGVDHAMEAIGRTHSVPSHLFKIGIHVVSSTGGAGGTYQVTNYNSPDHIEVSKRTATPALNAAHEYGHFLDHHLFGRGKPGTRNMASHSNDPKTKAEVRGVMHAIYRSEAARELVRKHDEHEKTRNYIGKQHTTYLLTPTELFARAYSQWVGVRSSPRIREEARQHNAIWMAGEHKYPAQWEDHDFYPIAKEFDRLFARRGLRSAR